ncbi:anti-anti-sigma factor [Actinopolyspora mzabensis]|uniref:Anti-anti-sigma factor n=1 Tax=Actinopolyspora mzabensis TaxID=995066 RepID=A0A1G9EK04_ACTMZ|nr:STAS domain-containing protein [Actinopolyspora mzabensis]SDK76502.1 anti-anti-sigma factor [Actinopolyspora mzabensis]
MTPTPFEQHPVSPGSDPFTPLVPEPARQEPVERPEKLRLRVTRPGPNAILLTAAGEVDSTTVTRFREVLLPRLSATARLLVVDLGAVEFLSVPGLELLRYAHSQAFNRGMLLRLVVNTHAVRRAMWQTGLDTVLENHPTVASALEAVPEERVPEGVASTGIAESPGSVLNGER